MMNMPQVTSDIQQALAEAPALGLGVHLVLTSGRPLLHPAQVPSLVEENGEFMKVGAFMERMAEVRPAEAKKEWTAQIEKFIRAAGQYPSHLDSHHHSSYFTEPLFEAMLELAGQYGCPVRPAMAQPDENLMGVPEEYHDGLREYAPRLLARLSRRHTDAFYATWYDTRATRENLLAIIAGLPESGLFELMCHPGYADDELMAGSIYNRQREAELAVLTDPAIRQAIEARGIKLVSY
jgi:predicted glycoside hydrolase/deacetylase ChbG (UPF0249 family)